MAESLTPIADEHSNECGHEGRHSIIPSFPLSNPATLPPLFLSASLPMSNTPSPLSEQPSDSGR